MRQQIQFLSRALGRRETVKYLSIAAVGAVIAPLTGCSGSTLAFKKFAAGTWDLKFTEVKSRVTGWENPKVTIEENGKWSFKTDLYNHKDSQESTAGTWSLSGTDLKILETGVDGSGSGKVFFHAGSEEEDASIASGVPETVDTDKFPTSFEWAFDTVDNFSVPVKWDNKSQTLTLDAESKRGGTFSIIATKQKK
ncbi:hypothetical protein [Actinomyces sp. ZJ308]|uniref:hypothetical protein n=1 Tax=Actinomyces sp. ZJ308 TaxID=2708342 RepID=UPI00141FF3E2|nr:hypothetical protein [Actinomyces sp. ZJ308]